MRNYFKHKKKVFYLMFIIPKPNFTRVGGGGVHFHMEEVGGVDFVGGGGC